MDVDDRYLTLAAAEIGEANKDLVFALLEAKTEHRVMKISGAVMGIERALNRIRHDVLRQPRPVITEEED